MPRFILNETSYHGYNAIENIVVEIKKRNFKKGFVCTDPDLIKFNVTSKITSLLDNENLPYEYPHWLYDVCMRVIYNFGQNHEQTIEIGKKTF